MIQATTETNLTAYLQTEDNRININVPSTHIRHLLKFTNDIDGTIQYAYGSVETIYDRYTLFTFLYNSTPDVYLGRINFLPAGYWKYEVYEVSWTPGDGGASVVLDIDHAPKTELDVLTPKSDARGIVQGLVTKGKMYVAEKDGTQEVKYSQNGSSVITITIIEGGTGYTSAPTVTISGGGTPITTATATCTVSGGEVNTVTITNAGNGYSSTPTIEVTGGGASINARMIASIKQTNYIYTG